MGRPIKASYFGTPKGTGVGGESVSNVTMLTTGDGYFSANAAVTFTAPQIAGGTTATGTPVLDGNGSITGVTITNGGAGYTSAPTATFTGANANVATANVVSLTSSTANAMSVTAWIPTADGGTSAVAGDVVKQVGSRRYKVTTAQGTGRCNLVAAVPAAGEMNIIAQDSAGGQYYVSRLESRTATLVPTTGLQFAANAQAQWTFGTAVENVSVTITNA